MTFFLGIPKWTPKTKTHNVSNIWNIIISSKHVYFEKVYFEHVNVKSCNYHQDIFKKLKISWFESDFIPQITILNPLNSQKKKIKKKTCPWLSKVFHLVWEYIFITLCLGIILMRKFANASTLIASQELMLW